jgi:hypothetical protein
MGRVVCLTEAESWRAECAVPEVEYDSVAVDDSVLAKDKGKKPFRGPFVPTVEEIHEAFDWIKGTRYHQPLHLGGDLQHILLTPFPSGHVLGGTIFKVRSPSSGTVLYAVGINHTGERHLDGMVTGELVERKTSSDTQVKAALQATQMTFGDQTFLSSRVTAAWLSTPSGKTAKPLFSTSSLQLSIGSTLSSSRATRHRVSLNFSSCSTSTGHSRPARSGTTPSASSAGQARTWRRLHAV